jgi:hypothetical protein
MLPTKFQFIWDSGFREKDFLEIRPPQAILVSDWPIFKNLLICNHLAK